MDKWILKNCKDLTDKKVVITGATGGLGKNICMDLASLNATLILACRNKAKADNLKAEILENYPQITVDFVKLDLENFESVENAIEELKKYNGIDILINNAGVYNVPIKQLDSGYNNVFQTNFVYPYYLTKKLLPELEKCKNSTCVIVGSIAHNYSKIDTSDIDFSTRKKQTKIYGNSKRFLMFSMFDLFKNSSVNLSVAHPGVTLTNMTNHYPKAINWLVKIGIKLVFPNPKHAIRGIVKGCFTSPQNYHWITPKLFNIWGNPTIKELTTATKDEIEKINEISHEIYSKIDLSHKK